MGRWPGDCVGAAGARGLRAARFRGGAARTEALGLEHGPGVVDEFDDERADGRGVGGGQCGGDGVPRGASGGSAGVGGGERRGVELEAYEAVALGDPLEALAEGGVQTGRAEVGEGVADSVLGGWHGDETPLGWPVGG